MVLHLLTTEGMDAKAMEDLLYRHSGMLGLSGISSDFRDLLASAEPRARFAIEVFVHRVARDLGSLAAALGGLDGIVFTAGVGENAAPIRAADLPGLRLAGRGARRRRRTPRGLRRISTPGSRVARPRRPDRREPR